MNHYYRVRQGFECGDTKLKQGEQGTIGHQFLMSSVAEFIPSLANITRGMYISRPICMSNKSIDIAYLE